MNTDKFARAIGFENKEILKRFYEQYPETHEAIKALHKKTYNEWYQKLSNDVSIMVAIKLDQTSLTMEHFTKATIQFHERITLERAEYVRKLRVPIDYNEIAYVSPLTDLEPVMEIENLKIENDVNF